jgi:hypothetical protein
MTICILENTGMRHTEREKPQAIVTATNARKKKKSKDSVSISYQERIAIKNRCECIFLRYSCIYRVYTDEHHK